MLIFFRTRAIMKSDFGMGDSAKNKLDSLFFARLFVPQASQNSSYRRREIAFAIFSSRPRRQAPAEWRLL